MRDFQRHSTDPQAESTREVVAYEGAQARSPKKMIIFEPADPPTASADSNSNGLVDLWHLIRSRKWTVFALAILGTLGGMLVTLGQTPIYQAHTMLEIFTPNENTMGLQSGAGPSGYSTESYIQTQVKMFQSASLRKRVLRKLAETNRLKVYSRPTRIAAWRKALGIPATVRIEAKYSGPPEFEVKARGFENTHMAEIVCDSPDPNFSADYVNTMSDEYIQSQIESRWDSSVRISSWLTRQLADLKQKLELSESKLQAYSNASGLMIIGDKEAVHDEKLQQLQAELTKAQGDRIAKRAVYEVSSASVADSNPQVIDNDRLSGYQSKLAELRREVAELTSLYTPEHYKVVRVKAQIAALESTFKKETEDILTRIRNEYRSSVLRETFLTAAHAEQVKVVSEKAGKAIYYDILKREVDSNRQLYDALLQKMNESSVAATMSGANARVVDPADPPPQPYKPSMVSNLLKGLASGLLFGVAFIVGSDRINRSMRAPGESPFHLKVPELAVIPALESVGRGHYGGNGEDGRILGNGAARVLEEDRVELVTWQNSSSLVAESFRGAIASILLSGQNGDHPRVILVTSARHGEGKSTVVSNLGTALAEINQKVLLIDADLRKPRLHQIFGTPNSWGLSNLLMEKGMLNSSPLEALARPTQVNNLHVLPSGPGTLSIANLLYSSRMSDLLRRLRFDFDTILIDTPPMEYISDARILGRLADAAILVIRAGRTTRDDALNVKERLGSDGIPILGTILNAWDLKTRSRYGSADYGYGHSYTSDRPEENGRKQNPNVPGFPS
jgi:succinoglycan biosynthesis transport protein ExoP